MPRERSTAGLSVGLLLVVLLWGASNVGTKHLVAHWPPILTGGTRFLIAGLLLHAITSVVRKSRGGGALATDLKVALWFRTGLVLSAYIVAFNWAVRLTSASHVALYLGAAPVWAALWEQGLAWHRSAVRKYAAAVLALTGVVVLFWPALRTSDATWTGEALGLAASVLWTAYGRQCSRLGARLSGSEITSHTMWRAGVILLVVGLFEFRDGAMPLKPDLVLIQAYCILGGAVIPYLVWNVALRTWPMGRVYLFNNLIPLSTMFWAWLLIDEAVTPTFGIAMVLVVAGVLLGWGVGTTPPGRSESGVGTSSR